MEQHGKVKFSILTNIKNNTIKNNTLYASMQFDCVGAFIKLQRTEYEI